jgi:hypothetical protein
MPSLGPDQPSREAKKPASFQLVPAVAGAVLLGAILFFAVLRSGILQPQDRLSGATGAEPANSDVAAALEGLKPFGSATQRPPAAAESTPGAATVADKTAGKSTTPAAGTTPAAAANDAAAQQRAAALEADLKARQQALDQAAAAQAQKERDLAAQHDALVAEENAARERELERMHKAAADAAAAAAAKPKPYSGPTSGDIVWEGTVSGDQLVTISGGTSDVGQVVSGALPGVNVLIALADTKHVRVASSPAPSNGYKRLVLGASGKGTMRITLHWSVP